MVIRPFRQEDVPEILKGYKGAFEGSPWFQTLEDDRVAEIWADHSSKRGFVCMVGVTEGAVAAAGWWDTPDPETLRSERGDELVAFARDRGAPRRVVVWEREALVHPAFQGRGFGRAIRIHAHEVMRAQTPGALVLTRMRDDNTPILSISGKLGFSRTGIRVASRKPGVFHEYWYLDLSHST